MKAISHIKTFLIRILAGIPRHSKNGEPMQMVIFPMPMSARQYFDEIVKNAGGKNQSEVLYNAMWLFDWSIRQMVDGRQIQAARGAVAIVPDYPKGSPLDRMNPSETSVQIPVVHGAEYQRSGTNADSWPALSVIAVPDGYFDPSQCSPEADEIVIIKYYMAGQHREAYGKYSNGNYWQYFGPGQRSRIINHVLAWKRIMKKGKGSAEE